MSDNNDGEIMMVRAKVVVTMKVMEAQKPTLNKIPR